MTPLGSYLLRKTGPFQPGSDYTCGSGQQQEIVGAAGHL
jgi:hypothetical protein